MTLPPTRPVSKLRGIPAGAVRPVAWGIVAAALALAACSDSDRHRRRVSATLNLAPAAELSVSGERRVGSRITFDGRGSADPDGDDLTREWLLVTKPLASAAQTADLTESEPGLASFVPDRPGSYRVRYRVSDGESFASASALVLIVRDGGGDGDGEHLVALICPSRAFLAGGEEVTIHGGAFPPETQVRFGDTLGLDTQVLDDGSRIVVRAPPRSSPGVVDISLQLSGDEVFLVPEAFTYVRGPLSFESGADSALDVPLESSPWAMSWLGGDRILAGFGGGELELFRVGPDGSLSSLGGVDHPSPVRIVLLTPGFPAGGGSTLVGGFNKGGAAAFVVTIGPENDLTLSPLDASGEVIGIAVVDLEGDGSPEVVVADRAGRRALIYRPAEGGGFALSTTFPTKGQPCVVAGAQLDGDSGTEVIIGSFPGPEVTLLDQGEAGVSVVDQELDGIDGIANIVAGRYSGGSSDELAIMAIEGDDRVLRFLARVDGGDPAAPFNLDPARFSLATGASGLQALDLDLDGDVDVTAFDGSSGSVRIFTNTRIDGPESAEECASILEMGGAEAPSGLSFRESELKLFPNRGIQALLFLDVDGDSFPDALGSHSKDLTGVRVIENTTGR